nr:EOG090X0MNC [Eurycercus lamellatus]
MPQRNKRKNNKKISNIITDLVNKANSQENPFGQLTAFHTFVRNGLETNLKCCKITDLDKMSVDWAFDLLKRNMKKMYEESAWGWDEKEKHKEMTESGAWYLIAYNSDGKPLAFSHFRFDVDYGHPVLYCYELQLEVECRRKGLGRFMLQVLELMAFRNNMEKIVLTVFLHNPGAVNFFKSLGYVLDGTSPVSTLEEQFDYEILSKPNRRKAE